MINVTHLNSHIKKLHTGYYCQKKLNIAKSISILIKIE